MSEAIIAAAEGVVGRDVNEIALEINVIKRQARHSMMGYALEVGKRLKEAKALVPFGEWGRWLTENVDYSERTAQNLMRVAEEYGQSASKTLDALEFSKAVALLALPENEREKFVEDNDVPGMSTRELQDALDAEKAKAKKAREELSLQRERGDRLEDKVGAAEKETLTAKSQLEGAEAENKRLSDELVLASGQTTTDRAEPQAVEAIPPAVQAELDRLRRKAEGNNGCILRVRMAYDRLKDDFGAVVDALKAAEAHDEETALAAKTYRHAVDGALEAMRGIVSHDE